MTSKKTITEGRDAPLYHATYIDNLMYILKDNMLRDTTSQSDKQLLINPRDKWSRTNGVSLTRSLRFARQWIHQCIIKLDQRKLAQKHRIVPIDYFSNEPSIRRGNSNWKNTEAEEFVLGPIKNLKNYIISIELYPNHKHQYKTIVEIYEFCKNNNIKISNEKDVVDYLEKYKKPLFEEVQLDEGRDAPLYHATLFKLAKNIIQSNELRAATAQSDRQLFPGTSEYTATTGVSLTRSLKFAMKWSDQIIFKLDQRKLAQRHKIVPIDYFSNNIHKKRGSPDWKKTEAEEFVIGPIKNLKNYIISVYMYPTKSHYSKHVRDVYDWCVENNITVENMEEVKKYLERMKLIDEAVSLDEGRDAPLYHSTSIKNFSNIIKDNELLDLTKQLKRKLLMRKGKEEKFFSSGVSLTRSLKFAKMWIEGSGIIFKLDQRKLAQRHKFVPIDYWQDNTESKRGSPNWRSTEAEEFLIGPIKNLKNYIISVYFDIYGSTAASYEMIKSAYELCQKKNIKLENKEEVLKTLENLKIEKQNLLKSLNEGRDAPLYHGTTMPNFLKMTRDNQISDKTSHHPSKLGQNFATWGVSLTRSLKFGKQWVKLLYPGIVLELDQRKLAQNYKIIPVDYFGSDSNAKRGPKNWKKTEAEEFLVGSIKNLKRYLTAIHIVDYDRDFIQEVLNIAKEWKVPVYYNGNDISEELNAGSGLIAGIGVGEKGEPGRPLTLMKVLRRKKKKKVNNVEQE